MTRQAHLFDAPIVHPTTKDKFSQDAMGFLLGWIKKNGHKPFSAEHVTLDAINAGVAAQDMRHWGEVFQRAAREGYIRRSDVLFRRVLGNGTLAPGWVRV